ncbi:N-acetyltransferase [Pseudomonas sp. MOB-449]|nr:N-acetyltransferase [Pseudomonas sp. MOB-449]
MSRPKNNDLKYQAYRSAARKLAFELVKSEPGFQRDGIDPNLIRYEPITHDAISASLLWGEEATLYPWEDVPEWKVKDRKCFDLSLWYDMELCGMCYATPRASCITIKIVLLEGKPDRTHPLRGLVAPLSLLAIDNYARMLGCQEIEIQDPEPGAVEWYEELGFTYDKDRRLVIPVSA